ncbi:MAG: endonuclease III [Candidatus Aenigmarchaeota archaeon]|nr:endonuclease III [Candidatus Aenigmarchaeota archaeon]
MPSEKETSSVIGILKKRRKEFVVPALTEIAERSNDPYKVLISCILSLRTRDETTARVSEALYSVAETPEEIGKMPLAKLAAIIRPVNYYKTKARRIKAMSKLIHEKYDGKVPSDMDSLLALKGVGRKTANIVMVYGFKKPGLPIDTHCHRIPNRLGWVKTKTPEKTEEALRQIIPKRYWMDLNDLFVQFGQNICTPRNPKCGRCPLTKNCKYYKEVYMGTKS